MPGITRKSFNQPDDDMPFTHGHMQVVRVGDDQEVWRSILPKGWNWDEDLKPYAEGATSCPMTHREYVESGRIRYLTDDGVEVIGEPGDYLYILPGHRAWTVGEETCVLIDW